MLNLFFYLTAALLILSKLPDLHSTLIRVRFIGHERNPMARFLMRKIGIKKGLYLLTFVYLIITILAIYIVESENSICSKHEFIIIGLIVSAFNLGIAHHNYTGKSNFFTKILKNILRKFYH